MTKKLDPSQPFGEIVGLYPEVPGARYTQNGRFYSATHDQIGEAEDDLAERAAAELAEQRRLAREAEAAKLAEDERIAAEAAERVKQAEEAARQEAAKAPPVEAPPVEAPPVEAPPAEAPAVEAPKDEAPKVVTIGKKAKVIPAAL